MFNTYKEAIDPDPYQGLSLLFEKAAPAIHTKFQQLLLGKHDIPEFLQLQAKVWHALGADQKHHLKLRSAEDLNTHLENRMPIIGMRKRNADGSLGKLVAQALVAYPFHQDAVKNLEGYPIKGNECVTAIVQSLAVDPDYKGWGMARVILDTAKDVAAMAGHTRLLAKVADDNGPSRASFLKSGFTAAAAGKDPKLQYNVTFWQCTFG